VQKNERPPWAESWTQGPLVERGTRLFSISDRRASSGSASTRRRASLFALSNGEVRLGSPTAPSRQLTSLY
jgi:hypothetical protein